jgi:hypothetical protein
MAAKFSKGGHFKIFGTTLADFLHACLPAFSESVLRFASAFRESCGIFLQKNRTLIIECAASASVASVCVNPSAA